MKEEKTSKNCVGNNKGHVIDAEGKSCLKSVITTTDDIQDSTLPVLVYELDVKDSYYKCQGGSGSNKEKVADNGDKIYVLHSSENSTLIWIKVKSSVSARNNVLWQRKRSEVMEHIKIDSLNKGYKIFQLPLTKKGRLGSKADKSECLFVSFGRKKERGPDGDINVGVWIVTSYYNKIILPQINQILGVNNNNINTISPVNTFNPTLSSSSSSSSSPPIVPNAAAVVPATANASPMGNVITPLPLPVQIFSPQTVNQIYYPYGQNDYVPTQMTFSIVQQQVIVPNVQQQPPPQPPQQSQQPPPAASASAATSAVSSFITSMLDGNAAAAATHNGNGDNYFGGGGGGIGTPGNFQDMLSSSGSMSGDLFFSGYEDNGYYDNGRYFDTVSSM